MAFTAFLYTEEDVATFHSACVNADHVVTLSPKALAAWQRTGDITPQTDSTENQRTAALAKGLQQAIATKDAILASLHHSAPDKPALRWMAHYATVGSVFGAYRVWDVLGDGPWLIPNGPGFETTTNKTNALELLIAHLIKGSTFISAWHTYQNPPWKWLYRLFRQVLVAILQIRGTDLVVTRDNHPFNLVPPAASNWEACRVNIDRSVDGWKEYPRLAREICRALAGKRYILLKLLHNDALADRAIFSRAIRSLEDHISQSVMQVAEKDILIAVDAAMGLRPDATNVLGRMRPRHFFAFEQADGFSAILAETCGRFGITRWIANHNAHTPHESETDRDAMEDLFRMQFAPELTDRLVFWQPLAVEVAKRVLSREQLTKSKNVVRTPLFSVEDKRAALAKSKQKIVLHAGNSHRWLTSIPWIYPTTDEFIRSLRRLTDIFDQKPNINFIVRLKKAHKEINPDVVSSLIPQLDNIKLKAVNPFAEDLKSAVVVISDMSTAILEAIQNRTPVLIYSHHLRYSHLKGRCEYPTPQDRAAVYSVDRDGDLEEMISAIIYSHSDEPLHDEEIAPYIWQQKTLSVPNFRATLKATS